MFRARFPVRIVLVLSLWIFALACESTDNTGNTEPQSTVETAESTAAPTPTPVPIISISAEDLYAEREANAQRFDRDYKGTTVRVSGTVCEIDGGDLSLYSDSASRSFEFCLQRVTLQDLSEEELLRPSVGDQFQALYEVGDYILGTMFMKDCVVPDQPESTESAPAEPTSTPVTVETPSSIPEPTATSEPTTSLEPTAAPTVVTPTPSATPAPSPTSTPIHVSISGSGTKAETVSLPEGLYIVDIVVTENEDCSFGSCNATIFSADIEGVDGGSHLLALEFVSEWSGSSTLRIGTGFLDVPSGAQIVSVDATGEWTITFDSVFLQEPSIAAGTEVSISGSGTKAKTVSLPEGLYIVDIVVTENEDCSFGSCSETIFSANIEGVDEGSHLLALEITSEWSGSTTLRIGTGFLDVRPGTQVVSVDAAGDWTITFRPTA